MLKAPLQVLMNPLRPSAKLSKSHHHLAESVASMKRIATGAEVGRIDLLIVISCLIAAMVLLAVTR